MFHLVFLLRDWTQDDNVALIVELDCIRKCTPLSRSLNHLKEKVTKECSFAKLCKLFAV